MPQKRKLTKKKRTPTRHAGRKAPAARKRRPLAKKPPTGEAAQIHQNIHPVEPTPELEPR